MVFIYNLSIDNCRSTVPRGTDEADREQCREGSGGRSEVPASETSLDLVVTVANP